MEVLLRMFYEILVVVNDMISSSKTGSPSGITFWTAWTKFVGPAQITSTPASGRVSFQR